MNFRNILIVSFLIWSQAMTFGQMITVKGKLPGAENQELVLSVYTDYISFRKEIIRKAVVDQDGVFLLQFELFYTRLVYLEIDYLYYAFYAEPGGMYYLETDTLNFFNVYRPFYNKKNLPIVVFEEPEPGLNKLISDFENIYSDFILTELNGSYQVRNFNVVKKLRKKIIDDSIPTEIPFVKNYVLYRTASLELTIAPSKKTELFTKYLNSKPVLYDHPEYMDFFNNCFEKHIYPLNRFISKNDLLYTVNYQNDLTVLLDTLGKDTLLRNEVIRELVSIKSLGELYFDDSFSKKNIIDMLDQIGNGSKFEKHQQIAGNLIHELKALKPGQKAPDFELPELLSDSLVSLSDFKGKPVYIGFFTTWSYACLAEFELMNDRFNEFGKRIEFITIALDRDRHVVEQFRKEKNYNWIFLYNGLSYDLLFDYRIKTFPSFVLIDSSGNITDFPAYKPSEIIHERFNHLLRRQNETERNR